MEIFSKNDLNIKLLVWRNAEYLAGYEQQDAHEFLIAALDMIHGKLIERPIGSEETKKTIIDQVLFSSYLHF